MIRRRTPTATHILDIRGNPTAGIDSKYYRRSNSTYSGVGNYTWTSEAGSWACWMATGPAPNYNLAYCVATSVTAAVLGNTWPAGPYSGWIEQTFYPSPPARRPNNLTGVAYAAAGPYNWLPVNYTGTWNGRVWVSS